MEFKTTFATTEVRTFPVPFIGMSTVRTLLRSVSGIYKEDMFSNSFGLVPDKLLKLIERPALVSTAGYAPLRPKDRSFRYPCTTEDAMNLCCDGRRRDVLNFLMVSCNSRARLQSAKDLY